MVAVQRAQDFGPHHLVGRAAGRPAARPRRRCGPSPGAARSSRGRTAGRRPRARWRGCAGARTISWALAGSRLASGSSSRRSLGRLMRAWAIRTRCCSPPDRVPDPGVGEALGADGDEHLVDGGPALARREPDAEAVPVDPQCHEVAGPDGDIGVEQQLLGHVARRRAAAGSPGAPGMKARPALVRCSPRITRSKVVLPAPLDPMRPVNSPAPTSKVTSSRIVRPPSTTPTCSTRSTGSAAGAAAPAVRRGRGRRSQVLGGDLVGHGGLDRLHLGQHPGLVVVAGGRHRLVDADDRDAGVLGRRRGWTRSGS